jgi:hypothetical protein
MKFELLPTITQMSELYRKPLSVERFREYLKILQGDTKDDLVMPVGGFNPMAKEHALVKLEELEKCGAEEIVADVLHGLNKKDLNGKSDDVFKVAINLSDDLKGGWTNRFTNDYDSKFKISALVRRKFCTPVFWTSEAYSEELIRVRTQHYCYRTLYWLQHSKPETLQDHVEMEKFVVAESGTAEIKQAIDLNAVSAFYNQHKESRQYDVIFNFLYGDAACKSLEFPSHGVKEPMAGFAFAAALAQK